MTRIAGSHQKLGKWRYGKTDLFSEPLLVEVTIPTNNLILDIWPPKLCETIHFRYFKATTLMIISYSSPRKVIYSIVIIFMIYQCLIH